TAALANARYGVRVNCIMPGLMNTPMAIESNLAYRTRLTREELIAQRDAQVPLRHKMGTAWDVAYAALYLASDEASFVTGVCLAVDGGAAPRAGGGPGRSAGGGEVPGRRDRHPRGVGERRLADPDRVDAHQGP